MSHPNPSTPDTPSISKRDRELLQTWKEIAEYLDRDVRTAKRWEHTRGLPVHRLPGSSRSSVYALKSEVDAWRQGAGSGAETEVGHRTTKTPAFLYWMVGVAIVSAITGFVLWRFPGGHPASVARVTSITTYPGVEWFPAFSPDGRQLAFSWNGEHEDNFDIYVKVDNAGNPLRLTVNPDLDIGPVWSHDGRQIAFVRWRRGAPTSRYIVIPALGGVEREVATGSITTNAVGVPFPFAAWSPDNRWLIIADAQYPEGSYALKLVSWATGETRTLTRPPTDSPGDCCPVVSPDGRTLAFLRASPERQLKAYIIDIAPDGEPSGLPRPLLAPSCQNPLWTRDGSELLCLIVSDGERSLWRIPARGNGAPRRLPSLGPIGSHFAISPAGDRLVYSNFSQHEDIWQLNLTRKEAPVRLIGSTADDLAPQFSPDGKRLAFLSRQSGHLAIWVSDRQGANARELTLVARHHAPQWSPDGERIAYTCRVGNAQEDICVIGSNGGAPRQFTTDPSREIMPSWSRDGHWLYFASDRTGAFQVWKTPRDTSARPIQVTRTGGYGGVESLDGKTFYYTSSPMSGQVWSVPTGGGESAPIKPEIQSLRLPQNFAVGGDGILFASSDDPIGFFDLRFYSFVTGKAETVRRIERGLGLGMSISPDGGTAAFTTSQLDSGDLISVENLP